MALIQNRKPIPAITSSVEVTDSELPEVFQNVGGFSKTVVLIHNYYILQYDVEFGVPELDENGEPALDESGKPITNDIETDNSRWLTEPATITKVVWANPKYASPFPRFISVSIGAGAVTFSGTYFLWFDERNFNWVSSFESNNLSTVKYFEQVSRPVVAAVDMNADLRISDTVLYQITSVNFDRVAGSNKTSSHIISQIVKNHWDLDRDETTAFASYQDFPPPGTQSSGSAGSGTPTVPGPTVPVPSVVAGPVESSGPPPSVASISRSPWNPEPGSTYTITATNTPVGRFTYTGGEGTSDGSVTITFTAPNAVPLQKSEQEIVFFWRDGSRSSSLIVIEDPVVVKIGRDSLVRARYKEFMVFYLGYLPDNFISNSQVDAAWLQFYYERYY
jgi:hypothetical protein